MSFGQVSSMKTCPCRKPTTNDRRGCGRKIMPACSRVCARPVGKVEIQRVKSGERLRQGSPTRQNRCGYILALEITYADEVTK
jgi:hypothetical protein